MLKRLEISTAAEIVTPGPRSALAALRAFGARYRKVWPLISPPDIAGSRLAVMRAWKVERTPLVCALERFAGEDATLGRLRHGVTGLAKRASIMAEPREVAAKE